MGCTSSSSALGNKDGRRHSNNGAIFTRQKISVSIGNEVRIHEGTPIIIAVFGGPGTKKGTLVGDLAQTFGFKLLSVEKLILRELAKVPDEVGGDGMCDIIDYVKESQEKVNLRWVLNEMKKEIDNDTTSNYIIDIMPNLKGLVRSPSIVKDPTYELKNFESFYPISFAITFELPLEKLIKKNHPESAKPAVVQEKEKVNARAKSDEADLDRTKKRASLFDATVRPFVDYFNKSLRLVHVDVSSGVHENIWIRICEIFEDLKFRSCCNSDTVIIIMFDEESLDEIELLKYNIQRVSLADQQDQPIEKVLTAVNQVIEKADPGSRAFAVSLAGTPLANGVQSEGKKDLIFVDDGFSKLDFHVKMMAKGVPCSKDFKAVSSLNNQVCLFPPDADLKLCRNIADFLTRHQVTA